MRRFKKIVTDVDTGVSVAQEYEVETVAILNRVSEDGSRPLFFIGTFTDEDEAINFLRTNGNSFTTVEVEEVV